VRGRRAAEDLGPADLTVLLGRGQAPPWPYRRLRWPDFWVPLDLDDALAALREAAARAGSGQRVEVACRGGVGRTGTALAALAVLDGLEPAEAVSWVRQRHHPRAVETPWQRRWLRHVRERRP
jgi:protein-tyrosine phosphatase